MAGRGSARARVMPGEGWSGVVRQGQTLRITDLEGSQAVDFLCYNAADHSERYHAPNTLKSARVLSLREGNRLYSDVARPLFRILKDTCGSNDTIGGCCSAPSNALLYGAHDFPGCRETFLRELAKYGMDRRDIVPNLNWFSRASVREGKFAETFFETGPSKPGDYVELRAEMDVLAVVSNCKQTNNPCNAGAPTAIEVAISD